MAGGGGGSGGLGPKWEGLLKWSLAHADGTASARQLSEEDRNWFMEAMQTQTVDVLKRMKEIALVMSMPFEGLQSQGITIEEIEGMLEELQEHVESIDMANDLHSIGGLIPLLEYLKNPHASIRAKAAEVVTTIVQNNPRSQQLVMDAKGLESLLSNFIADTDMTVRVKSLGAISSLIRNNKPAIAVFRLANGYAGLKDALVSEHSRFQRKALQVLQYLLYENADDCNIAAELGFLKVLIKLADDSDPDIRQAAMHPFFQIVHKTKDQPCFTLDTSDIRRFLKSRIQNIHDMEHEELGVVKEERLLLDSLWHLFFNEPSSLRENGLLVLPGEDELPPDVASKFFEPPLRLISSTQQTDKEQERLSETKAQPLLLAPRPQNGDSSDN